MLRRSPLYAQIKSVLVRRLLDGEWQVNQALPSEWALADELGVSQGTVRKALCALEAEGVLYRRQGSGTFVAEARDDWGDGRLLTQGWLDETQDRLVSELLGCVKANATEDVAHVLGIHRTAPVIQVRLLWRLRGVAVALDEAYLPAAALDGLDARTIRQCGGGVYATLQDKFGLHLKCYAEQMCAVRLRREDALLLGAEPEQPALVLLRLSVTYEGQPLEWRQRICLTGGLAYTVRRPAGSSSFY